METEDANFIPAPTYSDKDSLLIRLDPVTVIKEVEKKLAGGYYLHVEVQDANTGQIKTDKKFISTGKALMNSEGIQNVINRVSSIVNRATVLGNLPDDGAVKDFMRQWQTELRKDIFKNFERYGIESCPMAINIISIATNFSYLFLTRLIGGREAESLRATHTISEVRNPPERKGLMGFSRMWYKWNHINAKNVNFHMVQEK